jgi:thiol:disulfide interchange protein
MASRIPWVGVIVGAAVGAITRVAVTALHFPAILRENHMLALYVVFVGAVIGGVAGVTGKALRGAVVGAGLSVLFYLLALPVVGVFSFLGAATLPAWWEMLAAGAIPGAIGGWAAQSAAKRQFAGRR